MHINNNLNKYIINNDDETNDSVNSNDTECSDIENPTIKETISVIPIIKIKDPIINNNEEEPIHNKIIHKDSVKNIIEKSINGWDETSRITLDRWLESLRTQSFIYQYITEKNERTSKNLLLGTIILSSVLGIFSGSKIWISNDRTFQRVSDITIMLINFLISYLTAISQLYTDNRKSEEIRNYIESVDNFTGEIMGLILSNPNTRINSDEFFKNNNGKYTNLIMKAPSVRINEIINANNKYDEMMNNRFKINEN